MHYGIILRVIYCLALFLGSQDLECCESALCKDAAV